MSRLDVSLAHAREVPTRPVMERVLVSLGARDARPHLRGSEGSHFSRHTDGMTPPHHARAPVVSHAGMTHAGGGAAGPGGIPRADSGGLCLRHSAACAHTEEVEPCPPICTCRSKTRTRS
jgi:hypothetical protein